MATADPTTEITNHATTALQLLEEGKNSELSEFLDSLHPVELVSVVSSVSTDYREQLIQHVTGLDQIASLVSLANERVREQALAMLDEARIAAIVRRLDIDDAVDVVATLPRRKQVSVVKRLSTSRAREITKLLAYDQETAGGIMTPMFFSLPKDITVAEGIDRLRGLLQEELDSPSTNINYAYILDENRSLEGICSLRALLAHPPGTKLSEIMRTAIVSVNPDDDQEHVAHLIADYDYSAIPVIVPQTGEMVGIVTIDDVIDVIQEEHTEDVLKLVGTEDQDLVGASVKVSLKSRLPWLVASWLGGLFGALLLGNFSSMLEKVVALAFFMPVVFGMGGNVGSQSSTITVRGIATGELGRHRVWSRLRKEVLVGLSLGIIFGGLLGSAAFLFYRDFALSGIVGLSIMTTMTCSAAFGSMVPMVFSRFGFDPAVASGPFVTTASDILSITIYFTIASLLL